MTPYYIYNLDKISDNLNKIQSALSDIDIYYAIKANNDKKIIKTLNKHVKGYDAASIGEIELLLSLNINPKRILFNNPVKSPDHIKRAYKLGVEYFAYDSLGEIDKLSQFAPNSKLFLRLKVSDRGSKFPLSKKFGLHSSKALNYCIKAKEAGLHTVGLTFHVGSQSEKLEVWENAIIKASKVIKDLSKNEIYISILDVGGGFPVHYNNHEPSINAIGETIRTSLNKYIPKNIKIIAEPGRYIVANSSTIVTSVIGKEKRGNNRWIYLDIGAFQGLIEPLEMSGLIYPISSDKYSSKKYKYTLTGPTCDAFDTIGTNYKLPANIEIGDRVYIGMTGAYTKVYESNFNGFYTPKVFYLSNKKLSREINHELFSRKARSIIGA